MSDSPAGRDRVPHSIHILLIDDDPIFRIGLCTALEPFPDLQIVAQADTGTAALEILSTLTPQNTIDLIVLELAMGRSRPNQLSGLALCQSLKTQYPILPVLLLTTESEPFLLKSAKESGIDGYCAKGADISQIVQAIRQLVSGQSYWQTLLEQSNTIRPPSWHHKLRQSGLQQIENALLLVTQQLQKPNLSNVDWLFWSGRRRELLAARWVVNQLLPTDIIVVEQGSGRKLPPHPVTPSPPPPLSSSSQPPIPKRQIPPADSLVPSSLASRLSPQSTLFDLTLAKLQSGLSNLTGVPLEIDILKVEKRRHLLYILIQKFEDILNELRFSQVTREQLPQKRSLILQDLWELTITEFFGKYYTVSVVNQDFEIVDVLLSNVGMVKTAILDKIPLVIELLSYQLFDTPLIIDNVSYSAQTPEATERAEILYQNIIIQLANAVIQPLLNEFADIEIIKQDFYDLRLISSREIARLRNNLSWKYRLSQLVEEPQAIFESRYDLFILSDSGIKKTAIYAPRRQELEQLGGMQLAVTLAYETRDAIAPRLRSTVSWIGRGVVYVLTQVLGRSIGLVVRGVIQGIGSALQDTRFGKNGERGK
jgi:DNA-binding NarL/FixJ family response regulator